MNGKITILLVLSLMIGGCADFRPKIGPPWMQKMLTQGPEGPTNFKLGWRHGCETGMASTANRLQRHFYKFRQDYRLAQDPTYYSAWRTSYNYCQRYVFQYLRRNHI